MFFSTHFAQVLAFEPNEKTFQLLSLNSRNFNNIHAFQFGLGDVNGVFCLYENSENIGDSSIKRVSDLNGNKISIEVKRLDDIELPDVPIDFMKIDVEGF